ncbi:MAG: RNA 2',3'-cyclic phosphodiesterase [Hyphomicrobium sp.]
MPRLFSAIEIPDDVRDELYRLHQPLPGARWISKAFYHLTLRFVGDVTHSQAREFAANLAGVECNALELTILGLGAFGGDDPRSVWAGVAPSPPLDELARAHDKAARAAGLAIDKRSFKPHVTLARLKNSNAEAVAKFLTRYSGYRSEPFFVSRTVLMSSRPGGGGGPYGVVDSFPLRGGVDFGDEYDRAW